MTEETNIPIPVLHEEKEEEITGDIEALKVRIQNVADEIYHFDIEIQRKRGSIKKQLDQIYKLSKINNLTDDELRQIIVEEFERQGVDPSTIRKVMPEPLRRLEKINKRYSEQTPELIAEQFRKEDEQQQDTQVFFGEVSGPVIPSQTTVIEEEPKPVLTPIQKLEREIYELKREVAFWKSKAERYQERFTAKATISSAQQEVPVVAQINALERTIEHIEIDTSGLREEYEAKPPKPKKV